MGRLAGVRQAVAACFFVVCLMATVACAAPIHKAAARGDAAALEAMLKASPALVDARDANAATPLHWAVDRGGVAVCELLLSHGADPNAAKIDGVTPLHIASALGRKEIAALLLDKGANINSKDHLGRTPYSLARQRRWTEVADYLVSKGASTVIPLPTSGRPVTYRRTVVSGVTLDVISVDTLDPRVRLSAAIAQSGVGGRESFGSFVRRLQPSAAINGTFFSKTSLKPIGDIVVNGRLVNFGGMGTGLCVTPDNKVCFVTGTFARHTDWSAYETVVCSGPKLMRDGRIEIDTTGHRDSHVLGRGVRVAVGIDASSRLLMVATHRACSLTELAGIMRSLGCVDAVNFDGGASIGMYYGGRMIRSPSRALTNVLLVYEKS